MLRPSLVFAPKWFDLDDPDEREYWYAGVRATEAAAAAHDGSLVVWNSPQAAHVGRELFLASGHYVPSFSCPQLVTRQIALQDARESGCKLVLVRDEMLNLVEEWTV